MLFSTRPTATTEAASAAALARWRLAHAEWQRALVVASQWHQTAAITGDQRHRHVAATCDQIADHRAETAEQLAQFAYGQLMIQHPDLRQQAGQPPASATQMVERFLDAIHAVDQSLPPSGAAIHAAAGLLAVVNANT